MRHARVPRPAQHCRSEGVDRRGLDVDTMYGQLLRRMNFQAGTRYAVVVPEKLIPAASRVPEEIPERLKIDLHGVRR